MQSISQSSSAPFAGSVMARAGAPRQTQASAVPATKYPALNGTYSLGPSNPPYTAILGPVRRVDLVVQGRAVSGAITVLEAGFSKMTRAFKFNNVEGEISEEDGTVSLTVKVGDDRFSDRTIRIAADGASVTMELDERSTQGVYQLVSLVKNS